MLSGSYLIKKKIIIIYLLNYVFWIFSINI